MPTLKEIRKANMSIRNSHDALTAVFVGATHGIGLATLHAFAKCVPHPTAIVVGRSESKFQPELERIRELNENARITFFEADVALLANVDTVSRQIGEKVGTNGIDFLYESQGYLNVTGQDLNADGIDNSFSLSYYGRMLFAQNLLPFINPEGRIVDVLAGGSEGKMAEDDLGLKTHFTVPNSLTHGATLTTLALDHLSETNPLKAFIHASPGVVNTGMLGRSSKGVMHVVMRVIETLAALFVKSPEEVGDRMLFYATSSEFQRGCYCVDGNGVKTKEGEQLKEYRRNKFAEKVWEHNQEVFRNAGVKGQ